MYSKLSYNGKLDSYLGFGYLTLVIAIFIMYNVNLIISFLNIIHLADAWRFNINGIPVKIIEIIQLLTNGLYRVNKLRL